MASSYELSRTICPLKGHVSLSFPKPSTKTQNPPLFEPTRPSHTPINLQPPLRAFNSKNGSQNDSQGRQNPAPPSPELSPLLRPPKTRSLQWRIRSRRSSDRDSENDLRLRSHGSLPTPLRRLFSELLWSCRRRTNLGLREVR